jgi:hypothetical protein
MQSKAVSHRTKAVYFAAPKLTFVRWATRPTQVHSVFSGATVHPISGGNLRISHPDLAKDIFIQANPDCLKYGYGRVKAEVVDESAYEYPVVGAPIWPEPFGQTLYTETKTSSADPFTSFSTNWCVPKKRSLDSGDYSF